MKIKLSVLFLLFSLVLPAKGPVTGVVDTTLFRIVYRFDKQALKNKELFVITDTMALEVGRNWSVYYDWCLKKREFSSYERVPNEFVFKKSDEELQSRLSMREPVYSLIDGTRGTLVRVYKNRSGSKVLTIDLWGDEYLHLEESILPQKWELDNDTLTVLGYMCNKAVATFRGRTYTAWFTWDIPVNDGPWKLYGLPGMILKAEDAEGLFRFEAIGIEKIDREFIEIPSDEKHKMVSSKQMNAYLKRQNASYSVGFLKGDVATYYNSKNPVKLPEMELME